MEYTELLWKAIDALQDAQKEKPEKMDSLEQIISEIKNQLESD